MTMTSVQSAPYQCQGDGWEADVYYGYVILFVDPDIEDALVFAIDELLSKTQQPYWDVVELGDDYPDPDRLPDWEVYRLERVGQHFIDDALGLHQAPAV